MNTRHLLLILVGVVVLAVAVGGGYLLWQRTQRPDLATLLAECAQHSPPPRRASPAPHRRLTPMRWPDARGDEVPTAFHRPHLAQREDILSSVGQNARDGPRAEAAPSTDAPRIRDTPDPHGVLRSVWCAARAGRRGPAHRPPGGGGLTVGLRAPLRLGSPETPRRLAVREVRASGDPVARMDAARLGVAGDAEAIPDLVQALEDRVEARDSLGSSRSTRSASRPSAPSTHSW